MKTKNHKSSKMLPKRKRDKLAQILPQSAPTAECDCPECVFRRTHPDYEPYTLEVKGRPDLTDLKKHILAHAGLGFQSNGWVAAQIGADATKRLIEEGQFFPGFNTIEFPMIGRDCHGNSALLGADPRAERWMGFGLGNDRWVVHSWAVRKKDRRVIETTPSNWLVYFGVHDLAPTKIAKCYKTAGIGDLPRIRELMERS